MFLRLSTWNSSTKITLTKATVNTSSLELTALKSLSGPQGKSYSHQAIVLQQQKTSSLASPCTSSVTKAGNQRLCNTSLTGQFQFRKKKEKSTAILVSIVGMFLLCHSYRLCLKIYEFAKPSDLVEESFTYCFHQERYHQNQGCSVTRFGINGFGNAKLCTVHSLGDPIKN